MAGALVQWAAPATASVSGVSSFVAVVLLALAEPFYDKGGIKHPADLPTLKLKVQKPMVVTIF